MAKSEKHKNNRRFSSSYLTSIISMSLVLFLVGIVGVLIINGRTINKTIRENFGFNVVLKENVKEADIYKLQTILNAKPYSLSTEFVTKDEGAAETEQLLGEDFVNFLGYNPLPDMIKLRLHAAYTHSDSVVFIEQEILSYSQVEDLRFKKTVLYAVNENIRKISIILLGFSALLTLVAISLINNTIRLSVYARRFLINTMQLVGATRGFIRRPFLYRSVVNGFVGSLISLALLFGLVYVADEELNGLFSLTDARLIALLAISIFTISIVINWISTFFAVNKYLKIKTDKLYK